MISHKNSRSGLDRLLDNSIAHLGPRPVNTDNGFNCHNGATHFIVFKNIYFLAIKLQVFSQRRKLKRYLSYLVNTLRVN